MIKCHIKLQTISVTKKKNCRRKLDKCISSYSSCILDKPAVYANLVFLALAFN